MATTRVSGTSQGNEPAPSYPAEKARQGDIILRHKWSRVIFFSGLFGGVVVVVLLAILLGIFG